MFRYPVSMACTPNQYEQFIRKEILRIGYDEVQVPTYSRNSSSYVILGFRGIQNRVALVHSPGNMLYLGHFNPVLLLAVGAMTTDPNGGYGEYWKCIEDFREKFTQGRLYKAIGPLNLGGRIIYDNRGELTTAFPHPHLPLFRKPDIRDITSAAFNKTLR